MNIKKIQALADKAAFSYDYTMVGYNKYLKRFADLIAADERKACAQIAQDWDASHPDTNYGLCISNAIRARGEE